MPTTTSTTGYLTARVLEAARLSPSFLRVVLADTGGGRPATSGVPDEIVHLYFPAPGESAPPPMTEVDGVLAHHDPDDARVARNYTVRRWEQGRITIDFVDHGTGTAVEWARSARPGMQLGVWGTRAWYQPPADTRWMLLVADLTGVPAMLRILEQLPPGVEARAIAEVAHPADRLPTDGPHDVDWRIAGNGRAPSVLPTAVAEWDAPDGPGYVWFAGEASAGRAIRKVLQLPGPEHARYHGPVELGLDDVAELRLPGLDPGHAEVANRDPEEVAHVVLLGRPLEAGLASVAAVLLLGLQGRRDVVVHLADQALHVGGHRGLSPTQAPDATAQALTRVGAGGPWHRVQVRLGAV